MLPFEAVLTSLRAAGEPTRLRLLLLCASQERSVGELARVLEQSEPRVSRHLKTLCEAGLLERVRRGQWVCYRRAADAPAALIDLVLARIDTTGSLLVADRARAARAESSLDRIPTRSRLGRALARFSADMPAAAAMQRALVVDPAHLELIDAAKGRASRVTVLATHARAREVIRGQLGGDRGELAIVGRAGAIERERFDFVVLDLLHASGVSALREALATVAPLLAPHASIWLCMPYDALERVRGNVVEHPIAGLRRVLGECGFRADSLRPIEAEGDHVLAAFARLAQSTAGVA